MRGNVVTLGHPMRHGNVTPSLKNEKGQPHHGGVTCRYALHTAVLSLPALRRLHFPIAGKPAADDAGRTVLAALGLCAAVLAVEQGCDLRSRCLLVPEQSASWELVAADGSVTAIGLTGAQACALLGEAVTQAKVAGLPWLDTGLTLTPSPGLAALVKKSRDLAMHAGAEEA